MFRLTVSLLSTLAFLTLAMPVMAQDAAVPATAPAAAQTEAVVDAPAVEDETPAVVAAPEAAPQPAAETVTEAAPVPAAAPVAEETPEPTNTSTPVKMTSVANNDDATIAKQAIMIDFSTGTVMMEKNADERMPTSSMSKTMTLYAVFDAIKNGRLSLQQELPVSEKAWRMGGSKMFVSVGSKVKVEDLIRGVAIQSGNDATIVLAEGLSGDEDTFAQLITEKAKQIGMANTNFKNASGWPDPDHYSTARDLATLGIHMIRDFPEDYHYLSEKEFVFHNIRQHNRNPLLYRDVGADGIKTGHTEAGGYGLIGSAVREGRRIILVVNGLPDDATRAQESTRLIEWGLKAFENVTLFKAGDTVEQADIVLGAAAQVPLTVEKDVIVTLPTAVKNDLKVEVVYNGPIMAPVTKGQPVGVLSIDVPRVGVIEAPLVAAEDVKKIGLFAGMGQKAKLFFAGRKQEK